MVARLVRFESYTGCDMNQPESLLDPLDQFYLASGNPIPMARRTEGKDIPEPFRSLLVHEGDMTPRLEAACGQRIHLRIISRKLEGDLMLRQVVLVRDSDEGPVEFGAIRIRLEYLPPEARQMVLDCRLPLGRVLHDFFIQHLSQPVAYFELTADSLIRQALQTDFDQHLYGRRNKLLLPSGKVFAEVVEILPPAEAF